MTTRRLGIIMNGVTGRMGTNQHLVRSVLAIRAQGGVRLANGDRVMPDPILIGRNADKLAALAKQYGVERWSTDLDKVLADKKDELFFDAATTQIAAPERSARPYGLGGDLVWASAFRSALSNVRQPRAFCFGPVRNRATGTTRTPRSREATTTSAS